MRGRSGVPHVSLSAALYGVDKRPEEEPERWKQVVHNDLSDLKQQGVPPERRTCVINEK